MDLPENGIADIRIKIQGGDVMDRPMFKKGGGANKFPDLSGDGKVTQKDILISAELRQAKWAALTWQKTQRA